MNYASGTTSEYEIGGICVTMTAAQAAAWNDGDVRPDIYTGAKAYLTRPVNSYDEYDLAEVLRMDTLPAGLEALEGNSANLIRIR